LKAVISFPYAFGEARIALILPFPFFIPFT